MIYDCFLYNGEADMLELRLHELAGVVDRFVLVEAYETFTGQLKDPTWWNDRYNDGGRFREHPACILWVVPERCPEQFNAWQREAHQRNAIVKGLQSAGAQPDDLVLISDVDEIPKAEAVRLVANDPRLRQSQCAFHQTVYFYHPQCLNLLTWYGTRSVNYRNFRTAQELRATEYAREGEITIGYAGWHFSYFMDTATIQRKLAAYSHTEVNQAPYNTPENIEAAMRECRSLVPTDGQRFRRVQHGADADLPAYMLQHAERYGLEVAVPA